MEQDTAPADVPRKHGLGRSGVTVLAHYGAAPETAGRVRVKAGESLSGTEDFISPAQYPEARSLEQKSP